MTARRLRFAIAIVRAWTRIYTWRLDGSLGGARRAEVESDLWEQVHDPECATRAIEVWLRLLLGMADDVRWSIGHRSPRLARAALVVATASLTVISIWWVRNVASPVDAPPAPNVPVVRWIDRGPLPPPPPPPPPLCNPPGLPVFSPCTHWPPR
jgi:hypothetical protein